MSCVLRNLPVPKAYILAVHAVHNVPVRTGNACCNVNRPMIDVDGTSVLSDRSVGWCTYGLSRCLTENAVLYRRVPVFTVKKRQQEQ
jgi:hypothetical protein